MPGDRNFKRYVPPADDDETEFERFIELTEDEVDAEFETAIRQHNEWWHSLTKQQQYHASRFSNLAGCMSSRKMRDVDHADLPFLKDMGQEHLRNAQKRLLSARQRYYHGIEIGNA